MNGEASEEAIRRPHDKIATRRRACRAAVRAYALVHLLHSESDDGLEGLLRGRPRPAGGVPIALPFLAYYAPPQ
jgi:hypothetical protein